MSEKVNVSENEARYIINPDVDLVPDAGLGDFVVGYNQRGDRFKWYWLFWLLIPIIGIFYFLIPAFGYWLTHILHTQILVYKDGFLWQTVSHSGKVKIEEKVEFSKMKGMLVKRVRQYSSYYGLQKYHGTDVKIKIIGEDFKTLFNESDSYHSATENPDRYNHVAYALSVIQEEWNSIAIDRLNAELKEKGYCSFYSETGSEIQVNREFIRSKDHYVSGKISYSFSDGCLLLIPQKEEGALFKAAPEKWSIDLGSLYNSQVFLIVMKQFWGIK
ncbi:MAG: hypothetical protein MR548_02675 [Prevotella sp.]|nr:hypothetical protein [Prevotella sp.]